MEEFFRGMLELRKKSLKLEEKKLADADRARYRKDAKPPTPINSARPESFLLQTMKFEVEAREQNKRGRELWELFRIAITNERAEAHAKTILELSTARKAMAEIVLAKNWPEQQDALYERMYSHVRMAIFMQMG